MNNLSEDENFIKNISGILKVKEIIKDKFFFATIRNNAALDACLNNRNEKVIFYCAHNNLHYQPFIFDFGPYSLANIWKYCMNVKKYLRLAKEQNKLLVHLSLTEREKLVNSAFVCGCYAILYLDYEPNDIYDILSDNGKIHFVGFRDASVAPSSYSLHLLDCLKAIYKANNLNFIDLDNFDVQEYVHYEKVKNGDLNWIVPNKFLAFSGPHNKTENVNGYPRLGPNFYIDYFKKNNVTTIVRLNEKKYDERKFIESGFEHKDLIFKDGTSPSLEILKEFLKISENAKGALAVHCRAGLGRTGTLIACYLIKHYKFNSHEAIAWCRITRPGSVIANQQIFLVKNEQYLLFKGELYDLEHKGDNATSNVNENIDNLLKCELKDFKTENELNNKLKKLACKLNKIDLQIADQEKDSNENTKESQGDILNKLKWTRSRSRIAQLNQDNSSEQKSNNLIKENFKDQNLINGYDEQNESLFSKSNDNNTKNNNLSIKKLIQHYNSKCSENEKKKFQKKKIASTVTDKPAYRTRSFTNLLNRSKIHGSNPIKKPSLISDKLIKVASNFKINNKINILQSEKIKQLNSKSRSSKEEIQD